MSNQRFLQHICNIGDWLPGWTSWLRPRPAGALESPSDLEVEQSGVCFIDGHDELDYLWYRLSEAEGGREYVGYRVVRLLQLTFLPLEARSDPGLLQKMRTVLRGLYGSKVSFLYLAAGIFDNQQSPVGIVQCYGVSAFAPTIEEACAKSRSSLAALKGAMSGAYRQIRLHPLTIRLAEWIFLSFHDMNTVLLPSPVGLGAITEMLAGLAENTSTWAAWQNGVRGVSFGVSLPALLSGLLSQSATQGFGESQGAAHSTGLAHTDSQAHTDGSAHTTGSADTSGWSHMVSDSISQSTGQSVSQGIAH